MPFPSPHPDILCLLQSLDAAPGLADAVAPDGLLSAEERERYESFRVPKRRRDWLLGRWTAKRLIADYLAQRGTPTPFDQIIIRTRSNGSPYAVLFDEELSFSLSISHSAAYSFCALTDRAGGTVGADIEVIEPRPLSLAEQFFTAEELAQVLARLEAERDLWITLVWSAKEAFLKSIKEGLRVDTRAISVDMPESLAGEWQSLNVVARGELLQANQSYRAWWRYEGELVLTLGWLCSQ